MHCPFCKHNDTKVLDSRVAEDGSSIRRRRCCQRCEQRFTTLELMQLTVVKRSGATEAFDRDKAIAGVRKACKGRPVSEDDLARLGQAVEDALRGSGQAEFAGPRGRAGDPRPAARARRGRLPALRERLQAVRVRRRLRDRDRHPAQAPRGAAGPARWSDRTSPQPRAADPQTARYVVGKRRTGRPTQVPRSVPAGVSVPTATLFSRDHSEHGTRETRHDRDGERGAKQGRASPRD